MAGINPHVGVKGDSPDKKLLQTFFHRSDKSATNEMKKKQKKKRFQLSADKDVSAQSEWVQGGCGTRRARVASFSLCDVTAMKGVRCEGWGGVGGINFREARHLLAYFDPNWGAD